MGLEALVVMDWNLACVVLYLLVRRVSRVDLRESTVPSTYLAHEVGCRVDGVGFSSVIISFVFTYNV